MMRPIGIFDSGIGGLTVMQAVMQRIPGHPILYFGDTARVPYGGKSCETIQRYALEISQFLVSKDIQLLVVACNTATAYALDLLRQELTIPVIGVIAPGAKAAAAATKNRRIGVIGTRGTIRSNMYAKSLEQMDPALEVLSFPCPLFVPLVEEGVIDHPATKMFVEDSLQPLIQAEVDTVILGCTHYPLLRKQIQQVLGPSVTLIDSAITCAEEVAKNLLCDRKNGKDPVFYVTDDPQYFAQKAQQFLDRSDIEVQLLGDLEHESQIIRRQFAHA